MTVQERLGMGRGGAAGKGRTGTPTSSVMVTGPRVTRSWEFCPHPSSKKQSSQSSPPSLLACQLTRVTKASVAPGMCCCSGIQRAARNDNWVLSHFFKELTGYCTK